MKLSSTAKPSVRTARFGRATVGLVALLAVVSFVLLGVSSRRVVAEDAKDPTKDAEQSLGRVKNFAVPDYYDPPNQNQMKSLLRGGEAEPQANGQVLIKEVQLETYNTNGKSLMIVRAPDCTYDQGGQIASSSHHIEASSGDGKLFIEGDGFRWEQTNSVFVISNNVHTMIRQEPETTAVP